MSTHTIQAEIEVRFRIPDMPDDEHETAYPKVEITYNYAPARPAFTPPGEYAPIDPPEPAEVDFVSAKLIDGDGLDIDAARLRDIASDWLYDAGYDEAVEAAEAGPDPDYALERDRDDGQPHERQEWHDFDSQC